VRRAPASNTLNPSIATAPTTIRMQECPRLAWQRQAPPPGRRRILPGAANAAGAAAAGRTSGATPAAMMLPSPGMGAPAAPGAAGGAAPVTPVGNMGSSAGAASPWPVADVRGRDGIRCEPQRRQGQCRRELA
jgi:hypothetical protein